MHYFDLADEVEKYLQKAREDLEFYKKGNHADMVLIEVGKIKALEKIQKDIEYLKA